MSGVMNPGRRDTSLLTTVMKGVSIARDIYGIKADMERLDQAAAAQEKQAAMEAETKAEKQRLASGKFNPGERSKIMVTGGLVDAKQGEAGAMPLGVGDDGLPAYVKKYQEPKLAAPKEKKILGQVANANVGGKSGTLLKYSDGSQELVETTPKERSEDKAKPDQFKVATYAKRLGQSEEVFSALEKNGYNRAGYMASIGASLPGAVQSKEAKMQEQAERNFINAVLRRESGAAISPSEFDSAEMQYFPRAGDDAEVIAQKAANRRQVFEGFAAEAGGAMDKVKTVAMPGLRPPEGTAMAAPTAGPPTQEDNAALQWLMRNPKHPDAAAVKQSLRAKGMID